MTPEEHLIFYGRLKGNLQGEELMEDIKRYNRLGCLLLKYSETFYNIIKALAK
jgi:hypothetical protein